MRLSLLKAASLNFCLSELFSFEDVQPRCFILRSILPTRTRFLIDLTYFSLLSVLTKTYPELQLVRICARGDQRRAWAVFGPPRRSSVD